MRNNPPEIQDIENQMRIPKLNRRRFLKGIGMATAMYLLPLSACRRITGSGEDRPGTHVLSTKEKEVLGAVQQHMLPDDKIGPGAGEINALNYFEFVLADRYLSAFSRKLLINGITWVEETAQDLFGTGFSRLDPKRKEACLRDLETYKNGERWLSRVLTYIMEALLGAPAYGVNTGESGWKWLDHTPGVPQPSKDNIYGTFGYGV